MIDNKKSQLGIKSMINIFDDDLSQEVKNILYILNNHEKGIDYKRLNFKRNKNFLFDFRNYRPLKELFTDIYYKKFSIEKAETVQII